SGEVGFESGDALLIRRARLSELGLLLRLDLSDARFALGDPRLALGADRLDLGAHRLHVTTHPGTRFGQFGVRTLHLHPQAGDRGIHFPAVVPAETDRETALLTGLSLRELVEEVRPLLIGVVLGGLVHGEHLSYDCGRAPSLIVAPARGDRAAGASGQTSVSPNSPGADTPDVGRFREMRPTSGVSAANVGACK